MLDIDHFKKINDTYGHTCGDQALQFFAKVCKSAVRKPDIIGRIGGEEFAVILLEAGREEAVGVAERIRVELSKASLSSRSCPVKMTVSIGVLQVEANQTLETALGKADKLMYEAKKQGRNRVVS